MLISTEGVKNAVRELLESVRAHWPLLVSSGLLYLEIRNLRNEINELQGAVIRLADSGNSGFYPRSTRRTISASSTHDDWFSVRSLEESENELEEDEERIFNHFLLTNFLSKTGRATNF